MKKIILLLSLLSLNISAEEYVVGLSLNSDRNTINVQRYTQAEFEAIPTGDPTVRASSIISSYQSWNHRIPNMVDGSGSWVIADFYGAGNITFTYPEKYRINRIRMGSYCYRPESKRASIYAYNYDTESWQFLFRRNVNDYAIRNYNIPEMITDRFSVRCNSSRGYINEFQILTVQ